MYGDQRHVISLLEIFMIQLVGKVQLWENMVNGAVSKSVIRIVRRKIVLPSLLDHFSRPQLGRLHWK